VVVSKCLGFEAVRYNGGIIPCEFVDKLRGTVELIPLCPEMEIGLGTPRDPIHIARRGSKDFLLQPATGRDLTDRMTRFSEKFLRSLSDVDGFILKSRSPSCGTRDVKIYSDKERESPFDRGAGFFGRKVMELFPEAAIEDEKRLSYPRIRQRFLARVFTFAAFREVKKSNSRARLMEFHLQNYPLLMSYSSRKTRLMEKIVSNCERKPLEAVLADYGAHLQRILQRRPREWGAIENYLKYLNP